MNKVQLYLSLFIFAFFPKAESQIINTIAGNGVAYSIDGVPAISTGIGYIASVCVDSSGNYYFENRLANIILKVDNAGLLHRIAGNGIAGNSGDNGLAINAELDNPVSISLDNQGNIFIADLNNNKIRKVDAQTGIITTVAGNGLNGFNGDNSLAINAQLSGPAGVFNDVHGNLFILDGNNNRIRKVDINGVITTVAGNGIHGFSGDGGLADTAAIAPNGITVDTTGNIFLADLAFARVRKIDANTHIISTILGNGVGGYNGDEIQSINAQAFPFALAIDDTQNLYVADIYNNRIRKIDLNGVIHTVAGNGVQGFSGDGDLADSAELYYPEGVAIDHCGNMYIADEANKRIRKVTFDSTCTIGVPLAIQLHSFTGNAAAMSNMLYWQTSNEQGISKFELQRSEDGRTFNKIATVAVKNNSTDYNYTDETVRSSCYYRLKILETSGAYSYSDVVVIRRSTNTSSISLYPNPVREQLTVTGGNGIVITNALGQLVMNVKCDNYQTNIDVSGLKSGLYYVTVQDANGAISRLKFVKE